MYFMQKIHTLNRSVDSFYDMYAYIAFLFGILYITKTCPCNIQRFLSPVKIENFIRKKNDIYLFLLKNIDCGYTLEPPRQK